jgi:hypothetical protein
LIYRVEVRLQDLPRQVPEQAPEQAPEQERGQGQVAYLESLEAENCPPGWNQSLAMRTTPRHPSRTHHPNHRHPIRMMAMVVLIYLL